MWLEERICHGTFQVDLNLILQHLCDTPKYISFNPDKFHHAWLSYKIDSNTRKSV